MDYRLKTNAVTWVTNKGETAHRRDREGKNQKLESG
jgi:hypothetical protein